MATELGTYFTKADGKSYEVYQAKWWVRIKLRLETAGPVAVGTKQTLAPILSGRGELLPTGEWAEFYLDIGSRLYVAASTVNRVSYVWEQLPYAGITDVTKQILSGLGGAAQQAAAPVKQVAARAKKVVKPLVGPAGPFFIRRKLR